MQQEQGSSQRAAHYIASYITRAGLPDRRRRHPHRRRSGASLSSVVGLLVSATLVAASILTVVPAQAACNNTTPATGQTTTCDTSAPNPFTSGVKAIVGSSNVVINIDPGSQLAVTRTTTPVVTSVETSSQINNSGTISLTGGGGSGGNRGAAILGTGNNNVLTNTTQGTISTGGAFNDGMAANGSGNTLINNGTIVTTGPNAYGMSAAWGQTNTGQANNTLTNSGAVTTNGNNARAASILGQNGVVTNTGTLQTNGSSSTVVYMQGNNDRLTNSGIIHAQGTGSEGVFSNTAGAGFTAAIDNLAGGQIVSDQGPALRTLNGATTITNAGFINGGNGTALNGGNGNITFVLKTGSQIVGSAIGGTGNNVVRLQGTGDVTNPFTNFQTLVMEGTDWTWNGSGTFANTFVNSGALRLQSSLTGNVSIAAGTSLLAGNGANPSITPFPGGPPVTVTNAGLIDLTNSGSATADSLTIVGSYIGTNGLLNVRTALGVDNSPSDKLVISGGTASGTTSIGVTNAGGSGGITINNGILVVQATNGATTAPTAFQLSGGSVLAGAYQYYLFHGGVTAGTENNWYLRSSVAPVTSTTDTPVAAPNTPALPAAGTSGAPIPLFRPEVALYSAVPLVARQLGIANLGTFHDREGDQSLINNDGPVSAAWGRAFGQHSDQQWSGATNPSFNGSIAGLQSGLDIFGWDYGGGHRDRIGLFAAYGHADGTVRGFAGGFQNVRVGSLALDATSAGGYWTHIGPQGWYIDAVVMNTWYTGAPRSIDGLSAGGSGTGVTASLEGGYPIPLSANITLEPEAQLIYQQLSLDRTRDPISSVAYGGPDAVTGRIGARLQGNYRTASMLLQPYLKANLWHNFGGLDSVTFASTDVIGTQRRATAFEIGGGIVANLSSTLGIFAAAGYTTNLDDNRQQTVQGNVGLRVQW